MSTHRQGLDPRAWLMWALAAALPALIGRNPYPLIASLIAVAAVRAAWAPSTPTLSAWGGLLRIALVFAGIGVLFNLLTVRAGDRPILTIPDAFPVIGGGELTWNALIYGLLTGIALFLLVLVSTTLSALLDWAALVRLMPSSLTTVAVAGSVAFAFIPQTATAFTEIREAQAARGHRLRGGKDLLPIIAPMLALGLERAVTLAETLESRAFGAPTTTRDRNDVLLRLGGAISLTLLSVSAYLAIVGRGAEAVTAVVLAVLPLLPFVLRSGDQQVQRTQYRTLHWRASDTIVLLISVGAIVAVLATSAMNPGVIPYVPYPTLTPPAVPLIVIALQLVLIVPAFLAPAGDGA